MRKPEYDVIYRKKHEARLREQSRLRMLRYSQRLSPELKQDRRLRRYGLSTEDYEWLFASQSGVCAVCLRPDKKMLAVDHDHKTGRVRGLLCGKCNSGIGMFREDIKYMSRAMSYLVKYAEK